MRFSLRTLVIVVLVLPPIIALVWWDVVYNRALRSLVLLVFVAYIFVTALISGPPRDWQP
jgi:hypothetical protein